MRRIYILSTIFLLLTYMMGARATASNYILVDEPALTGDVILVDDLFELGKDELIIGRGNAVYLMQDQELELLVSNLAGNVTALAAGDLTGDFRKELVVGTDNAGAFYIYEYRGEKWRQTGQPRYMWSTVTTLEVVDINADGWGDLLAVNQNGDAEIYLSWEGELFSFWKSTIVQQITAIDLTGDGMQEVLFTRQSGYIGVLQWDDQQLTILWENYPWGQIESMVVITDSPTPEWMVVTNQKMVYSWCWSNDEVVSVRHFHAPSLGELLTYFPGTGLLSFSRTTGASMFTIGTSSVTEQWNVPDVNGWEAYSLREGFLVRTNNNFYFWLLPDDGKWTVLVNNRPVSQNIPLLFLDGQIYYDLVMLAPHLELTIAVEDPWHVMGSSGTLQISPSGSIMLNGLKFPGNITIEDNVLYVSDAVFSLLGWETSLEQSRRQVHFWERWGWWFQN